MRITHPDGSVNPRKLDEYRKRAIQFTRDGMIKGFYYNPDDPQGIAVGNTKKENLQGFNNYDDYNRKKYIEQIPLDHEY